MPEPVLKITRLSSGEILPDESSDLSAAKHAAPSGATKSPSLEATSAAARIISSSLTAMAPPSDWRRMLRIRKSPIALGTRNPEASVCALGNSAAQFSPASNARTMGAQPSACTENIRGRFWPIQRSEERRVGKECRRYRSPKDQL